jgi:putative copper resistance protein D
MHTALLMIARTVHIGASILIAGTFTFDVVTLGAASPPVSDDLREVEGRFFRLAVWSLVAAVLSSLLWFWLTAANMSGVSLTSAFSAAAWRTVFFQTQFGGIWQLRLGLIAIAFVLAFLGLTQGKIRRRSVILVLWFLSAVLLVSLAWVSHAAAAMVQPLGLLGDLFHLCAAGAWVGGLVPLAIFLARAGASFSLGEMVPRVVERFSTLSLCCVSVLVASGISNSWLLVGSIHALFTTPYGRLLLFKLTLFSALISFGARNRFLVKTKLRRSPAVSDWLPQLRRNVICEACLAATVVTIVACLGVTPPARHP